MHCLQQKLGSKTFHFFETKGIDLKMPWVKKYTAMTFFAFAAECKASLSCTLRLFPNQMRLVSILIFVFSASFATINYLVPILGPFLSPSKGVVAYRTCFCGEMGLFVCQP